MADSSAFFLTKKLFLLEIIVNKTKTQKQEKLNNEHFNILKLVKFNIFKYISILTH